MVATQIFKMPLAIYNDVGAAQTPVGKSCADTSKFGRNCNKENCPPPHANIPIDDDCQKAKIDQMVMPWSKPASLSVHNLCLDWPLSKDEKRQCVLNLYEKDVRTANHMLEAKDRSLETMHSDITKLRQSVTGSSLYGSDIDENSLFEKERQRVQTANAIASAIAAQVVELEEKLRRQRKEANEKQAALLARISGLEMKLQDCQQNETAAASNLAEAWKKSSVSTARANELEAHLRQLLERMNSVEAAFSETSIELRSAAEYVCELELKLERKQQEGKAAYAAALANAEARTSGTLSQIMELEMELRKQEAAANYAAERAFANEAASEMKISDLEAKLEAQDRDAAQVATTTERLAASLADRERRVREQLQQGTLEVAALTEAKLAAEKRAAKLEADLAAWVTIMPSASRSLYKERVCSSDRTLHVDLEFTDVMKPM
jgi:DNA repair exonuclease SbcCD ATPase subunit